MSETNEAVDLSAAMPVDSAVLEIMKPGGVEGTGWKITFAGPGHPKAIAWSNEQSRRGLRKEQRIEQAQVNGKKYKPDEIEVDDRRRENVGWVVSRILDWTPVKIGGETIAFSESASTALLMRPDMGWAFGQMVEFLADERSFTRRSAAD